jgi:hypothetical protein
MTSHGPSPRSSRSPGVDLAAVAARCQAVFDDDVDPLAALMSSAADVLALVSEVAQLRLALVQLRLRHRNLEAAARATLAAYRDGEPDPWAYLADELHGCWPPPSGDNGRSGR